MKLKKISQLYLADKRLYVVFVWRKILLSSNTYIFIFFVKHLTGNICLFDFVVYKCCASFSYFWNNERLGHTLYKAVCHPKEERKLLRVCAMGEQTFECQATSDFKVQQWAGSWLNEWSACVKKYKYDVKT